MQQGKCYKANLYETESYMLLEYDFIFENNLQINIWKYFSSPWVCDNSNRLLDRIVPHYCDVSNLPTSIL